MQIPGCSHCGVTVAVNSDGDVQVVAGSPGLSINQSQLSPQPLMQTPYQAQLMPYPEEFGCARPGSSNAWLRGLSFACAATQFVILVWQVANRHAPAGANQLEALDGFFRVVTVGMTGLIPLVIGSALALGAGRRQVQCIITNIGSWFLAVLVAMLTL